jgi:hypothetical protein
MATSRLHSAALAAVFTLVCVTAAPATAAPNADLWAFWKASEESSDERVDHGTWQRLLDRYLAVADDGPNLFRYDAVSPADRAALMAYLDGLAALDPRRLARAEQLAYWINLYNALTVQVVLDHPRADSILAMGGGWFSRGPWNDDLVEIAGQPVTLNDIEHRILRPIWQDHHIHYAVNCASFSCPDLAAEAYTRDNARRLMDAGEHSYLRHPRGLDFDPDGELRLSSIFEWYVEDFGGSRESLLSYLADERPDLADRLRNYRGGIDYHYDWSLNAAEPR